MEAINGELIPLKEMSDDNQKTLIFDYYLCEKNHRMIVEYLIGGRHKNCSLIYLSQSYYKNRERYKIEVKKYDMLWKQHR